jgi:hypothetical protein
MRSHMCMQMCRFMCLLVNRHLVCQIITASRHPRQFGRGQHRFMVVEPLHRKHAALLLCRFASPHSAEYLVGSSEALKELAGGSDQCAGLPGRLEYVAGMLRGMCTSRELARPEAAKAAFVEWMKTTCHAQFQDWNAAEEAEHAIFSAAPPLPPSLKLQGSIEVGNPPHHGRHHSSMVAHQSPAVVLAAGGSSNFMQDLGLSWHVRWDAIKGALQDKLARVSARPLSETDFDMYVTSCIFVVDLGSGR